MFNSYGSRRGNDRVMTRGTFANIRVRNDLAPATEGGWTTDFLDGEVKSIYEAAMHYQEAGVPLVVIAGSDYGMGSSRDWAAKGPFLLGVRVVIARSFERIHRSNLVMMGVLPLTFLEGQDAASLELDGTETFDFAIDDSLQPRQIVKVTATARDGSMQRVRRRRPRRHTDRDRLPPQWWHPPLRVEEDGLCLKIRRDPSRGAASCSAGCLSASSSSDSPWPGPSATAA